MAKKNTLPSGLISASAALAESQMPRDYTADFMKSFGAITDKFEKERKAEQAEIAGWLEGLTTDIDFTRMPLQMETATKDQLLLYKNEIFDLANTITKSKNKGSIEVKNATDRINEIYREVDIMEAELSAYNQDKITTTLGIEQNAYSLNEDITLYRDIYGLKKEGTANASFNGGHLVFDRNGEKIRYDNVLAPIAKDEIHKSIIDQARKYENGREYQLTDNDILKHQDELKSAFNNEKAFGAFLLDTPKEFQLKEISDEYITAKNNGTLVDVIDDLKDRATEMIIQGYKDAAAVGISRYDAKLNNSDDSNNLYSRYKKPETVQAMIQAQEDARAEGVIIGAQEPPNLAEDIADYNSREENVKKVRGSSAKIFKFGPSDNPDQIRIKLDPTTKKWVYFNSKSTVKSEYNNLLELMNSHPGLFYINKQ